MNNRNICNYKNKYMISNQIFYLEITNRNTKSVQEMQIKKSLGSTDSLKRTAAAFYPATTACELFTSSELSTVHPRQHCHLSFCEYWLTIRSEDPKKTLLILTRGALSSPSSVPSRVHPSVQPC